MTYLEASYLPFRLKGKSGGFDGKVGANPIPASHQFIMSACIQQLLKQVDGVTILHPYKFSPGAQELKN